ncbi:hypothetical protein pipiens_011830 [Culex pipiens pipiens]|uniref:C2H2-type domain-containing protein n=1 Tax=Culex pipiens pipiens TaxID=38569 RepID=A0ABD1D4R5_CULPP
MLFVLDSLRCDPLSKLTMLGGKYSEPPEAGRNRPNPVVMSMMVPPPPLYPAPSLVTTPTTVVPSTAVRRPPNDSSSPEDGTTASSTTLQYQCQLCLKCFASVATLTAHLSTHEQDYRHASSGYNGQQLVAAGAVIKSEPQPFQLLSPPIYPGFQVASGSGTTTGQACQICQKIFSTSDQFQAHMKIHEDEFRNRALYQAGSVQQQQQIQVKEQEPEEAGDVNPVDCIMYLKPNICTVCNKVFLNNEELTEHMNKQHNQVKPHRCQICLKTFTQSNNLKTHMKTHIFMDPFKCHFCSRSFQNEEEFARHSLVHSSPKPFSCPYCNKQFIQSNNLKTHVRTHTGEKPYKCFVCDRLFNQKNNLNTHLRIHQGLKPYQCTICQKRFNQSNNLNKHIYKVHCHDKIPGVPQQQQQQQPPPPPVNGPIDGLGTVAQS